jgi:hypothetical protein
LTVCAPGEGVLRVKSWITVSGIAKVAVGCPDASVTVTMML